MISELYYKVKYFYEEKKRDVFIAAVVFLVGLTGFGLGRLSVVFPAKTPLTIHSDKRPLNATTDPEEKEIKKLENSALISTSVISIETEGKKTKNVSSGVPFKLVASKNGATYYFPWCANIIKEENKVYFESEESAKAAGYRLAKNCNK